MKHTFTPMSGRDTLLMGFHYMDNSNLERTRDTNDYPINIYPYFEDYLKFMQDDLLCTSYADFWRWWYILERYKGDELGMTELENVVDECLSRGIKVKIDPAWNTWWSLDEDWETYSNMPVGPQDLDDWIHFCELMARRYRGKITVWDLQGEANSLDVYWRNKPWSYVHDIYRIGYEVFKSIDSKVTIGVSGASPSVPLQAMNDWYWGNLENCRGYYDNVPMNFFHRLADPYRGCLNYYRSIQDMLDKLGLYKTVEIGMGETSVQWAESTVKAATDELNMRIQTEGINELYGSLFSEGMNKNIMWFTEYAPGGGHWPWRWGLRNYEDWWGIWPDDKKLPGTRIVYRYDAPDGTVYDMRPEWKEPENPYYPGWEIHKFWQQVCPAGQESVRAGMQYDGEGIWKLASYHKTMDTFTAVAYIPVNTSAPIIINVDKASWKNGEQVSVTTSIRKFDFDTGRWSCADVRNQEVAVENGNVIIAGPEAAGFLTVTLYRESPRLQAQILSISSPDKVQVNCKVNYVATVRNTGSSTWDRNKIALTVDGAGSAKLPCDVLPGGVCAIGFDNTADTLPGHSSTAVRMNDGQGGFGPEAYAHTQVIDCLAPRKLVAHPQAGSILVQWFSPTGPMRPVSYELYRAIGYHAEFTLLSSQDAMQYVDDAVSPGIAYYYKVRTVYSDGSKSAFSITDNAKARRTPFVYDANIVSHTVVGSLSMGQVKQVSVTYRNSGSKAWKLNSNVLSIGLCTALYFGNMDEKALPLYPVVVSDGQVLPGDTVTLSFPICAPATGSFECHFVLRMDVKTDPKDNRGMASRPVYFGTPLLMDIKVNP